MSRRSRERVNRKGAPIPMMPREEETKYDRTTFRLTPAARVAVERWAAESASTMTAEINRAILERAARERAEEKAAR
jgi:hypothetical protein